VEEHGFREYYNPLTGEGAGAHDFSWTALVLDMLANPLSLQGEGQG
jgi:Mannosylglycerate hydrolase MGH1-like glycoside hydrolase domain